MDRFFFISSSWRHSPSRRWERNGGRKERLFTFWTFEEKLCKENVKKNGVSWREVKESRIFFFTWISSRFIILPLPCISILLFFTLLTLFLLVSFPSSFMQVTWRVFFHVQEKKRNQPTRLTSPFPLFFLTSLLLISPPCSILSFFFRIFHGLNYVFPRSASDRDDGEK